MAVGDVDVRLSFGAEDAADVAEQPGREIEHRSGIDVHRWPMHGLQHLVRYRGGAGDGQELASRSHCHCGESLVSSRFAILACCAGASVDAVDGNSIAFS